MYDLGAMVYACNVSIQKVNRDQELKASLGYKVR